MVNGVSGAHMLIDVAVPPPPAINTQTDLNHNLATYILEMQQRLDVLSGISRGMSRLYSICFGSGLLMLTQSQPSPGDGDYMVTAKDSEWTFDSGHRRRRMHAAGRGFCPSDQKSKWNSCITSFNNCVTCPFFFR